jgi:hypothetical protein
MRVYSITEFEYIYNEKLERTMNLLSTDSYIIINNNYHKFMKYIQLGKVLQERDPTTKLLGVEVLVFYNNSCRLEQFFTNGLYKNIFTKNYFLITYVEV